jgi:hypothetical protein
MRTPKHHPQNRQHFYRPLLVATLAIGGFLQFVTPLLADGTPAGTAIRNTATATYEDPNQPGTPINATSNTVTVTVAEVAGITVTPLATTDVNGGTVLPNDVINYDFKITNVGNDPTLFFIPNSAAVSGPGTQQTASGQPLVQITGYIAPDGTTTAVAPINVTSGATTADLGVTIGANPPGVIPAGYSLVVRVPVQVNTLAPSGAPITVVLGNTGANDNTAGTQNQSYPTAPSGNDVYTVDYAGSAAGEVAGDPANGQREASSRQQVLVGAQPQAFAAVLKTRTNHSPGDPNLLTDDILTYSLSLRVDATAPVGSSGLTPARLVGTAITLNGSPSTQILVSDAIPTGTVLTGTPTAPTGWTIVYTNSPTSTIASQADWRTNAADIGGIANATRIGFIHTAPIETNTTVTGFTLQVLTSSITTNPTVANIAQLFGQTQDGGTRLVYDESGDATPSNFNDNGTPGSNTPTNGVANPTNDGVDSGNNNTGSGPGGEDNVFTLAAPGTILNGPNGQPAAVGPTNNNDDFTNQSVAIEPNTAPDALIDPGDVTFTNTINNPSSTDPLTGILLVPDDGTAVGTVPTDTLVTLTYGSQTAVYRYNGNDFVFSSGNTITIPSLAPGESVNYTVVVNLPADTPLSTTTGNGFPVPIHAFVDSPAGTPGSVSGRPDATDPSRNATINRVYTGFLRMVKDARILDASGNQLVDYTSDFSAPTVAQHIRPGNVIQYRIRYNNISTAPVGAGNRLLSATNVVITEDGVPSASNTNNWAGDFDNNGIIDTSNLIATASASNGTITFFPSGDRSGTTATTDVTRYVNTLGVIVEPQASGEFTFRRRIN